MSQQSRERESSRTKSKSSEQVASPELHPSPRLLVKLGSIVVHADELASPDGRFLDRDVMKHLIDDAEVQEWIAQMGPLLPLKRTGKDGKPQ